MIRQELVQYVYQHLKSGHSAAAIRAELAHSFPEQDIDDAFEAVGTHKNFPTVPHHSHNLLARILLIFTLAAIIGLILGLITVGSGPMKKIIIPDDGEPDDVAVPRDAASTPSVASAPRQPLPPTQTYDPLPVLATPPSSGPLPSTGFGRCAAIADQDSREALECRRLESQTIGSMSSCNTFEDLRVREQCARAFYELSASGAT